MGVRVPPSPPEPDRFRQRASLHNASKTSLTRLDALCPAARIFQLEVSLDFEPRSPKSEQERLFLPGSMQRFLLSRIYPWEGPGLQVAMRTSHAPKNSSMVINSDRYPVQRGVSVEFHRQIAQRETICFGHSDDDYVDKSKQNLAFGRLYRKMTDDNGKKASTEAVAHKSRSVPAHGRL